MLLDLLNIKKSGLASLTEMAALVIFPCLLSGASLPDNVPDPLMSFVNPIIRADYSDPDVIRVGNDFYLIASSFINTPGIPVLRSNDLIHWQIIGYAIENLPDKVYDLPQPGSGVWAPSLRYHNGEYYIYYGDPDLGIFLIKSKDPAGPWEKPWLVKSAKGWIDPCPFWDNDGQAYLIHAWAKSRVGFNSILTLHKMSPDGRQILDEGKTVFDGNINQPTIEGPKLYERNGWYYVFAPAGGVRNGWQTVLRAKNIFGPYEEKIVLEQGRTAINGPHQGAWIETAEGESWFIHFQDREAYGRVVHLQPLQWQNDWPVIGVDQDGNGVGEPVSSYHRPHTAIFTPGVNIQTSDDFSENSLGLQWQWRANHKPEWFSLIEQPGYLRLYAVNPPHTFNNLGDLPNLLTQKFPAEKFEVVTKIKLHPESDTDQVGLIVIGSDYYALKIIRQNNEYLLLRVECLAAEKGNPEMIRHQVALSQPELFLKVIITPNALGVFSYSQNGKDFLPLGKEFQAAKGKWVGAQVGLFATTAGKNSGGYADVDYFRVTVNQ
jgi:beta-xylosidase